MKGWPKSVGIVWLEQPTDTVLVDGQMMSKEAIPFDGRAEIRPDDNVHTLLNQL
jgi:hypothetical protein